MTKVIKSYMFFAGGCYVEGEYLRNAFRWKATVGPWQERAGHFNDVWNYWSDDGLGYFEYLQVRMSKKNSLFSQGYFYVLYLLLPILLLP